MTRLEVIPTQRDVDILMRALEEWPRADICAAEVMSMLGLLINGELRFFVEDGAEDAPGLEHTDVGEVD